ncbi:IucA/IucC family protein [Streptomyces phytohabitans]
MGGRKGPGPRFPPNSGRPRPVGDDLVTGRAPPPPPSLVRTGDSGPLVSAPSRQHQEAPAVNARSGPEGTAADGTLPVRPRSAYAPRESSAPDVPRPSHHGSGPGAGTAPSAPAHRTDVPDPLEDADPAVVADAAAAENLLRCWVRESALPGPEDGALRVPLHATGTTLCVPVRHWSPTGWHRFGPPLLDGAPLDAAPLDAVALAALLGREAAYGAGGTAYGAGSGNGGAGGAGRAGAALGEGHALVGRVADSVRRTAEFLTDRRAAPDAPPEVDAFLDAEQALLLGHPLHPTPKSREGLSETEAPAYSPELRGSFPLHWMAVDASVLATGSAWYEDGEAPPATPSPAPVPAADLTARLAGDDVATRLPDGAALLPLHPWQARELRHRPAVARLLAAGLLRDLGPGGAPWYPTSSVRTLHRPGAPAMVKLSLGLRITNSRRENLRKELLRGVEVHRLLRTGLGADWRAAHPGFDIVRDPAWLGVDDPYGEPVPGLDTVLRHNPFGPADDAVCLASLTSPRPWPGGRARELRSRLADLVGRLAERTGRPPYEVADEWFARYLDAVVAPVLWLDAHAGIALEAHQQNTLVLLDSDGWPRGGRYRDNQGYYFRASHRAALDRRLPGVGVASDSYVPDDVTDERFAYYLGINNVLGLVGAFGSQGLADERPLLAAFRRFLDEHARGTPGDPVSPLPALLLEAPTLRCKANLLTRLNGMDELVGPVDTQSVYVPVRNPLSR